MPVNELRSLLPIRVLLKEACQHHLFSGFQVHFEKKRPIELCGGRTSYWPKNRPVNRRTLFDIASLTKVVATTSIVAKLCEAQRLLLTEIIEQSVPELKGTPLGRLTLFHCLTHSSGLVAWRPLYERGKKNIVQWLRENAALLFEEVSSPVYSDLNFLLVGLVLERRFGDLQTLFQDLVKQPLKLSHTFFGKIKSDNVAATQYCLWRKRLLSGEVFDENCYSLGGRSAHAGLFSNMADLAPFCREWLKALRGESDWLGKETAQYFTQRSYAIPKSTWAIGWDTKSKAYSSAGDFFSPESFGHLGYTGTSLWIDPTQNAFCVLLTNRVHPSRYDDRIKKFRPRLHNEIVKYWRSSDEQN